MTWSGRKEINGWWLQVGPMLYTEVKDFKAAVIKNSLNVFKEIQENVISPWKWENHNWHVEIIFF